MNKWMSASFEDIVVELYSYYSDAQ